VDKPPGRAARPQNRGGRQSTPLGTITRGTTAPNRLRRVDRWVAHVAGPMLAQAGQPLVVDLGFGGNPVTTDEMQRRLSKAVGRPIDVIGLEIDPDRVREARSWERPHLAFGRGGFEMAGLPARPHVVRAFNVLRQYPESEVSGAWRLMSSGLAPGGLLVEGTCDELGRVSAWLQIDGTGTPVTLTFSVRTATLDSPATLAERLPKALIHHNVPGQPVYEVLRQLESAWATSAPVGVFGARQRWMAMAREAIAKGMPIREEPARWRLGELTLPWTAVKPL
jgi:hypothetical protein